MKQISFLFFQFICVYFLYAQHNDGISQEYNPHDFFSEGFNPPVGSSFRSANGSPGPLYWQNSASYLIHATLSEKDTTITGNVTITYTNNSPDILDYLWLQLDQNIFNPSSRAVATAPLTGTPFSMAGSKYGYNISNVSVIYKGKSYKAQPIITDTKMQIRLNNPILPKGDVITIKLDYNFSIPPLGRLGRLYTPTGMVYQIAQWFPRMCVYDDNVGWNTLPYLGQGEFYCNYGDYEYFITAPSDLLIFGSGDLQNPTKVLSAEQINRLKQASTSDKTVTIIGADDIAKNVTRSGNKETLTWHFKMKNSRDVAFAAGKGLIWDAAKVDLPSGRKVLAMSAYPQESIGDTAWSRSTEYLKQSIEIYSKNFFEYPWNNAVSIGGAAGGIEYPGMIFNNYRRSKAALWFLISHEIGHNWFPMIVGSNERKYMWMDEGLNTYINYRANEFFNNGEYLDAPVYSNKNFFASLDYNSFMFYKDPLMTFSDAMDRSEHYQYYGKTAYGLNLLRNVVVGEDRFDYAFKKFTEAWAFKHPTPYDFFQSINNAVGEDLNWFWKGWFFTTWKLDQAVKDVKYIDNDPSKGSLISIENKGKMILPVLIKIVQVNGATGNLHLPVEVWQRNDVWIFKYPSTVEIEQIILDPDNKLPDVDRTNNEWNKKK
ncbi:MAG: M1 family metallopeptidase [Chitinophagaceae bacterium]